MGELATSSRTSPRGRRCRTCRPAISARRRRSSARPAPGRAAPRRSRRLTSRRRSCSPRWPGAMRAATITAQLVNDGAGATPQLSRRRNTITVHAATDARARSPARRPRSSPRSTPPGRRRRSSRPRCTAPTRAPASSAPSRVGPLSDLLQRARRPAARPVSSAGVADRHARTAPRSASSSTARSTPASGPTPLRCVETAERLVRNYAHRSRDEGPARRPRHLHDPVVNPDGAHYSMFDFDPQRRTWPTTARRTRRNDPAARNGWGVDLNRNYSVGSLFDGYVGASPAPATPSPARPRPPSRRLRNDRWVTARSRTSSSPTTCTRSAATSCGRPGAYMATAATTLSAPPYGIKEVLLRGGQESSAGSSSVARRSRPAHGADLGRHLLGGRLQGGRPVAQPRHHRLLLRDQRRPLRLHPRDGSIAAIPTGFQPPFPAEATGSDDNARSTRATTWAWSSPRQLRLLESAYDYARTPTAPSSRRPARRGQRHARRPFTSTRHARSTTRPTARPRRRPPRSGRHSSREQPCRIVITEIRR